MDKATLFKNALQRAKQMWKKDKEESEEMYGEGVLTRRQAKIDANAAPAPKSPEPEPKEPEPPEPEPPEPEPKPPEPELEERSKTPSPNEGEEDDWEDVEEDPDNIFNKESLVAENNVLQVYVIKTFFKRQKKFNLEDHQYVMHFKKIRNEPILLGDVLDILEKAFFSVLENLKNFYKKEEENIIYMTLTQENLFNPFRTSPYLLQGNDTKQMVDHLMVNFNRFVNSNQSLPLLEKSFAVYFKVLSNAHVNHPNHRRKRVPIRATVGGASSNIFLPGGVISIPKSYPDHKNIFDQNCLTTSVVLGHLKLKKVEKYLKIKKMFYVRSKRQQKIEAGDLLSKLTNELCRECGLSDRGPYEVSEVLPKIVDHLNIQVHVILTMDGVTPTLMSFPPGNNKELPRIYLQLENDHINLIDNLQSFFLYHKRSICFDCKTFFSNHWRKTHRCRKSFCCFNCHGTIITEKTITVQYESTVFCDSKIPECQNIDLTCNKCNLPFKTELCFKNHEKLCSSNALGWKCLDCGIFESAFNQQTNQELQSKHVCGIKQYKCLFCFKPKDKEHVCQIHKQFSHDVWPNLGFLHMAFKDQGSGNCDSCFEIRKAYMEKNKITYAELFKSKVYAELLCSIHISNSSSPSPNVINFFQEEERHSLKEYLFCDDDLESADVILNRIDFPYSRKKIPLSKNPFKMKKTRQTVSVDFKKKLDRIFHQNVKKTAVEKMMLFFCQDDRMANVTVVVSEARILLTILEAFLKLNVTPNVIQDGNQINLLEVASLKLKFVLNGNYLKGSIFSLATQFGLTYEKTFFPFSWNNNKSYTYKGVKPSVNDFYLFGDTPEEKEQKADFYKKIEEPWCFKEALISNVRNECQTFTLSCLAFLTMCFELQDLIRSQDPEKKGEIHPYGWRISSISGFTFAVYAYFFMNDLEMFSVMHPFSGNVTQTSQGEYEWTSWLNYLNSDLNIVTAFNSSDGQVGFGKHFVDGYSAQNKTVYQFKGCEVKLKIIIPYIYFKVKNNIGIQDFKMFIIFLQFHYHVPPDCLNPNNKDRTIDSKNSFGVPLKKLLEKDNLEKNILLNYFGFDVKKIESIYECEWKRYKETHSEEIKTFWSLSELPKIRPLIRLVPRATLRGGFIEVYRLKFTLTENPGWTLHFADANSLYSHVVLQNEFPVGKYEVLLAKNDLKKNISFKDGEFFYKGESMKGDAAHVKILAPTQLLRPYLPYRLNDEFSHLALCKACLQKKLCKSCKHRSENVRAFTSCYQVTDLAKAVALGYKILEWYEVHHYKKRDFIFSKFVKILAAQKLRNTDLFGQKSAEEKQKICDDLNLKMNFDPNLALQPNAVAENNSQKELYKNMLNSFYGRFALHTNFTHHYFCRNLQEIERYASQADTQIVDIFSVSEDVCEIEVVAPTKVKPNLSGPMYLTSEINALGRKFIYEKSEEIENVGGVILSMDTDSIFFALPANAKDPLVYSQAFGDFKEVLGSGSNIKTFHSFGPRNYSVTYTDSLGNEQHLLKIKGLSTKSSHNCDIISPSMYHDFIEKRFHSEVCNIYLPQMRKKVEKQTKKFHEILTYFEFGNDIHAKRFIFENEKNYISFPFGFKF